jgi:hypothetical protein
MTQPQRMTLDGGGGVRDESPGDTPPPPRSLSESLPIGFSGGKLIADDERRHDLGSLSYAATCEALPYLVTAVT